MLIAYVVSLIVGGAFVMMSILFGGEDADADADMDLDADADADFEIDHDLDLDADMDADFDADVDGDFEVDHDLDLDADADADIDAALDADTGGDYDKSIGTDGTLWLPFLSFKFWTFLLAGFGLTGTVLTLLSTPFWLTLGASVGVGLLVGLVVGYALHRLKKQVIDSTVRFDDYVGKTGYIMIPPKEGEHGKIHVDIRGQKISVIALTDDDYPFERGDEVFIFRCNDDGIAEVVHPARVLWRDGRGASKRRQKQKKDVEAQVKAEVEHR